MTRKKIFPMAVAWIMVALFVFAGRAQAGTDPRDAMGIVKIEKPEPAPDFTLKNTKGREVSLSDFKGKAVFLTFWATW